MNFANIMPSDIDASKQPLSFAGHFQTERVCQWLVQYCQQDNVWVDIPILPFLGLHPQLAEHVKLGFLVDEVDFTYSKEEAAEIHAFMAKYPDIAAKLPDHLLKSGINMMDADTALERCFGEYILGDWNVAFWSIIKDREWVEIVSNSHLHLTDKFKEAYYNHMHGQPV